MISRIVFGLTSGLCLLFPAWEPASDAAIEQTAGGGDIEAVSVGSFLNSLGVNVHVAQGHPASNYIEPLRYIGVGNIRDSGEHLAGLLQLHQQTGVKVDLLSWCYLNDEISSAQQLASAGALLSMEGPNEPNNFSIKYNGKTGDRGSWLPVAQCQQALYRAVKNDKVLRSYPVFDVSEVGAEATNVGLQYLIIPAGVQSQMPDGTQYADYANVHNYVSSTHKGLYEDNQAWQAADPLLDDAWDGLYAEYGRTWRRGFRGYSDAQLNTLPRVTTETGWDSGADPGGQSVQASVLINTYLSQFKRGWDYTFIYELVDSEGSSGDQGLYTAHYAPKLAATYIHNLTTILADNNAAADLKHLSYSIPGEPTAVHDLLLQKSNGIFELAVWGELATHSVSLTVDFGVPHRTVNLYDVAIGPKTINTYSDVSSIPLVISDHAMIVEIVN